MKKQIWLLCSILALLVLLTVSITFLNDYTPMAASTASSAPADAPVILLNKAVKEITALSVDNASDHFVIRKSEGQWKIDNMTDVQCNQSMLEQVVGAVASCYGTVVAEEPEHLADFGLQTSLATVCVEYENGSFQLQIGDVAPTKAGRYVKLPDSDTVYLLVGSSLDYLIEPAVSFVDTTVTMLSNDIDNRSAPTAITFSGSLRGEQLSVEQIATSDDMKSFGIIAYDIITPKKHPVRADLVIDAFCTLMNIKADGVVQYNPTADQLAECGLAYPYSTAAFDYLDSDGKIKQCAISASKPQNGQVFLTREGVPLIYKVNIEELPWLEFRYQDIVSMLLLMPDIVDVSTVTIETAEIKKSYDIAEKDNDITVSTESLPVDAARFKSFYQTLIGLPAEQYTEERPAPDAKPIFCVVYSYHDGRPPDKLELYEGTAMQLFLSVNGETEFLTKRKYLETILQNVEDLQNIEKPILSLY